MKEDRIGMAYSRQKELNQTEDVAEGYFNRSFSDRLSASLDLQWLIEGTYSTGKQNKNLIIPGVRVTIYF